MKALTWTDIKDQELAIRAIDHYNANNRDMGPWEKQLFKEAIIKELLKK